MSKKITIYATTTCGYCKMLKSYLQSKKIDFEEKLADQNPQYAQELMQQSNQLGVTFTIIDDGDKKVGILGFDKSQIDKVLGLS